MRYRVFPYKQGSKSARALADALGGRVLKLQGSGFNTRPDDVVINWGNIGGSDSTIGHWGGTLNNASRLKRVTNKLLFFQAMREAGLSGIIPDFWTDRKDIPDDAFPVVCRCVLAGHSGDGIVIASNRDGLVHASLYVRYVKKQDEYRVHTGRQKDETVVIAVQRKARSHAVPNHEVNWQVRSHKNGFVFVREGVNPPASIIEAAKQALEMSGLDFGAVDVIYNADKKAAFVLEINTAPGLEGQTVADYASFFKGM